MPTTEYALTSRHKIYGKELSRSHKYGVLRGTQLSQDSLRCSVNMRIYPLYANVSTKDPTWTIISMSIHPNFHSSNGMV